MDRPSRRPFRPAPSTGLKRVTMIFEHEDGITIAHELNGAAIDFEVTMDYERGRRNGPFGGDPLSRHWPERDDQPYNDEMVITIRSEVSRPEEAPDGWLTIKVLKRHPDLEIATGEPAHDPDA